LKLEVRLQILWHGTVLIRLTENSM